MKELQVAVHIYGMLIWDVNKPGQNVELEMYPRAILVTTSILYNWIGPDD